MHYTKEMEYLWINNHEILSFCTFFTFTNYTIYYYLERLIEVFHETKYIILNRSSFAHLVMANDQTIREFRCVGNEGELISE